MRIKNLTACLMSALFIFNGVVSVAEAVQVNMKGTLVESIPCSINNGGTIDIDFGNAVIISKIDGVKYGKPVAYNISCNGTGNMRMMIQGTATGFDTSALQANASGLGLRFEQGSGTGIVLNRYMPITMNNLPAITVVPVINPAQPPSPGAFNAKATLLVDYQ